MSIMKRLPIVFFYSEWQGFKDTLKVLTATNKSVWSNVFWYDCKSVYILKVYSIHFTLR